MRSRPPTGSRPINETEWSDDHRFIKDDLNLRETDSVYIDPNDNVWVYHPNDGTWTNEGYAGDYTGPGRHSRPRGFVARIRPVALQVEPE
jgi:hypothetical protein